MKKSLLILSIVLGMIAVLIVPIVASAAQFIATNTTISSSSNPSYYGQSISLNVYVAPGNGTITPTGTITFLDGSNPLNSPGSTQVTVPDGSTLHIILANVNLAVGSHPITVVYSGDANYASSTSPVLTQVVTSIPETGDTGVNGFLGSTLSFTQPGTVNFGAMALGVNDVTTSMNVISNGPWTVSVAGTAPNSTNGVDGYMTKYSALPAPAGTYTPTVKLQKSLNIVASGGYLGAPSDPTEAPPSNQNVTLTGTPQILATGIPEGQTTTNGETRIVDFVQTVVGNDAALASGYYYHIVVSFTCTASY